MSSAGYCLYATTASDVTTAECQAEIEDVEDQIATLIARFQSHVPPAISDVYPELGNNQ